VLKGGQKIRGETKGKLVRAPPIPQGRGSLGLFQREDAERKGEAREEASGFLELVNSQLRGNKIAASSNDPRKGKGKSYDIVRVR